MGQVQIFHMAPRASSHDCLHTLTRRDSRDSQRHMPDIIKEWSKFSLTNSIKIFWFNILLDIAFLSIVILEKYIFWSNFKDIPRPLACATPDTDDTGSNEAQESPRVSTPNTSQESF